MNDFNVNKNVEMKVKGYELNINDVIIIKTQKGTIRKVMIKELFIDAKLKTIVDGFYLDNRKDFHKVYRHFDWILKQAS